MTTNGLARLKLAAALIITIGASAGGMWYSRHKPVAPPRKRITVPGSETTKTLTIPTASANTPITTASPAERPADDAPAAQDAAHEPTPAVAPDLPQPSSMPLEDIVERTLPAVVRIDAGEARGSGFFVRPTLVLTNAHVTGKATTVTVTVQSGERLAGRVLEASETYDIAVIQVGSASKDPTQLPLGQSAALRLGQGIVALGWAEGTAQSTVARGVVTGLRPMGTRQMVQTDAAPHPGDSGGPVVNRLGEVVGVTTFRGELENGHAVGLAVPIDDAKVFVQTASSLAGPAPPLPPAVTTPAAPATAAGVGSPRATGAAVAAGSESDVKRQNGLQQYERDLKAVGQRADRLDGEWSRYRSSCKITDVPSRQSREWFNLYDPASPLHRTVAHCASTLADLQRQADGIGMLMRAADELARRADVFPGTRRELRQRARLDYAGWER